MLDLLTLKQLNNPDPSVRKQAVMTLAKSRNQDALPYLATVHKNDQSPEIRQLAKKAGIYIRKQSQNGFSDGLGGDPYNGNGHGADSDDTSAVVPFYEEIDLTEPEKTVHVSAMNMERAQGMFQRALDADVRGNRNKATKHLRDALRLNPSLKKDHFVLSLATSVTGVASGEMAVDLLLKDDEKKKRERKHVERQPGDEATWINALIDLLVFGLVCAATLGLAMFIFFSVLIPSEGMEQRIVNAQNRVTIEADPVSVLATFLPRNVMDHLLVNYSGPLVLTYSAIFGVICLVSLLVYYLFVHAVSAGMLGGEGSFTRLVTKATLTQAVMFPVFVIGVFFAVAVYIKLRYELEMRRGAIIMLLPAIVYLRIFSLSIAKAYRFEESTAMKAIIIATVALIVVVLAGLFIFSALSNGVVTR